MEPTEFEFRSQEARRMPILHLVTEGTERAAESAELTKALGLETKPRPEGLVP